MAQHARPVRGLQELRVRGQPVHHRVPVLRQPAAQARPEARRDGARRRGAPQARASAARRRSPRLRRGEIPGIRADVTARPYATIVLVVARAVRLPAAGARRRSRSRRRASTGRQAATGGGRSPRRSSTTTPATRSPRSARSALFGWLLERRHGPARRRRAVRAVRHGVGGIARRRRGRLATPSALGATARALGAAVRLGGARPAGSQRAATRYEGDLLGDGGLRGRDRC